MEKHSEHKRNMERMRGETSPPKIDLLECGSEPQDPRHQEDPNPQHPEVSEGDRGLSSDPVLHQHVGMLGHIRRRARQGFLSGRYGDNKYFPLHFGFIRDIGIIH